MKKIKYPDRKSYNELVLRPSSSYSDILDVVEGILSRVRDGGDVELVELTKRFDGAEIVNLRITKAEFQQAANQVPSNLKTAIDTAKANIEKFHKAEKIEEFEIETSNGVMCWAKETPVGKVGLYIPGGTAPLLSTVLMLGVPAKIAGCPKVILCTPPNEDGTVNPGILYAASAVGINEVYRVGGAQAIAAMAYGTESIPKVSKIFGPGNRFVTVAKQLVNLDGIATDLPAGPTELAVFADESCIPRFVAADLLSQAEHGTDSQVFLVSTSEVVLDEIGREIIEQVKHLPRNEIAVAALENSRAVLVQSIEEGIELVNCYAPEHLIIACSDARRIASEITDAGSVFLGNFSPESAGDYASGTNHTLPTGGAAKGYSGVSVKSFMKRITYQELSIDGLNRLSECIQTLARAEELEAHARAVAVRLTNLKEK